MPDFYGRLEDPHGPLPHVGMTVQDGHIVAIITVAEQRFVLTVEKALEGWNVYWDPADVPCHDNIYEVGL